MGWKSKLKTILKETVLDPDVIISVATGSPKDAVLKVVKKVGGVENNEQGLIMAAAIDDHQQDIEGILRRLKSVEEDVDELKGKRA
jgi:hypothetical protein